LQQQRGSSSSSSLLLQRPLPPAMVSRVREFSSVSLRRPPQRKEEPDARRKWRTHAVSLNIGDYSDDDAMEDNEDYDRADEQQQKSSSSSYSWEEEEYELAEEVKELQKEEDAQKQRWMETSLPPVRKPVIDERGRAYGRGGRKTASARVWIQPGLGHVVVNKQDFVEYFERSTDRELILAPLAATATCGKFDITAMVTGGGLTGQAGAIRHGLARALNHYNPDTYRPPLKRLGYLTRDPRKVERKKIGHLKARKKPQWVKR
jgi:small subunit ribosomal protein S9